jgi:hypothetical protein
MKIIVDSREQAPFTFQHEKYAGTIVEAGTLDTGDYSLAGLADKIAVERKSLPDLAQCLGRERERFERELQRAAALDAFAVVVESTWGELAGGSSSLFKLPAQRPFDAPGLTETVRAGL